VGVCSGTICILASDTLIFCRTSRPVVGVHTSVPWLQPLVRPP
jgi:hypothetical protein